MWDGANTVGTDLREGLLKQARGNITGAQQGTTPVTPEEIAAREAVVGRIVDQEMGLYHAQIYMWGVGRLDADGARGGPEFAAAEGKVQGPFNLFDAWAGPKQWMLLPGAGHNGTDESPAFWNSIAGFLANPGM